MDDRVRRAFSGRPPRFWVAAGGAGVAALALLIALGLWLAQLLDPDRPVRELALRDARAAATLDLAQVYGDYSACYQRRVSEAEFISLHSPPTGPAAPADANYSVVAVQHDGAYRRVEVRVEAVGRQVLDYEIDERQYGGRWVVVDHGALGHQVRDDCRVEATP